MRLIGFAALLLLAAPSAAAACSALEDGTKRLACYDKVFSDVRMIRCTDALGSAICELLSPAPDNMISCIAFDPAGAPLARAAGVAGFGVLFSDLDASKIDHLDCQLSG